MIGKKSFFIIPYTVRPDEDSPPSPTEHSLRFSA